MKSNLYVTIRIISATVALAAGITGQLLLSSGHILLAVFLFIFAIVFFVFTLNNQPGPAVEVNSQPSKREVEEPKENQRIAKQLLNYDLVYQKVWEASEQAFRSIRDLFKKTRLFSGLIAIVLGVSGQILLMTNQILIGTIITGIGVLFFGSTFWKQPGPDANLEKKPIEQQPIDPKWSFWGKFALGSAILFAGLSFWMFGTSNPAIYAWLLHLGSISLLILSSFWMKKSSTYPGTEVSQRNQKNDWTRIEIGIFLVILVLAAFMRLYRLNEVPFGLWYDEADDGLNAIKILNEPGYLPVFAQSTALPAHFIYVIALFFRLLGVSTFSLRAGSVFFGVATAAAAFFTGQELFNRKIGFVLAFFLAVSRWDINWSRIAMHGVTVPFFEILSIGLILRSLRKQRLIDYTLAGLALGLSLGFYPPLRLFPIVICVFLLFLWSRRHHLLRSSWRGFIILTLSIFIGSVPVSQYAIHQPNSFFNRMEVTSIFTGKSFLEGWKAVAQTTREHLLMFNYHGDNNGRHNLPGEPMLDPISGALLLIGSGLSVWRIRQPGSFLLLAWLFIMLAPGIFSLDFEAPQSYRAIGSLPAAYLLAVVPIHALWQEWEQFPKKLPATVFVIPLIFVLTIIGYINFHIYFDLQATDDGSWSAFSTPETIIGKTMAELGTEVVDYVSVFYSNTPTVQFLAPKITTIHTLQTYDTLPIPADGKQTVAFFVDADRKPFFEQAQHYYPNAEFKEYKSPKGTVVLYQITLKPSDISTSEGITASYYRNANWTDQPFLVRNEKTINIDWKPGEPAQFPFGVKWQGVLYAENYGLYHFTLRSPATAEFYLDNNQVPLAGTDVQTAEVDLAKGSHDLILKTMGSDGHFELDWQPPNGEPGLIPTSDLFLPPISNNGLLGEYFPNGAWQSPPAFTEIDPWIHFYYQNQPLPSPFTVEWTGKINITEGGHYSFGLESIDESILFIDDRQIVGSLKANQDDEAEIDLSPGFHTIRLRYANRTGYTHINLYWTPPNSDKASIPQEVLFPP